MRKLISTIIVSTLLIGGCSTVHKEAKHTSQSIPEEEFPQVNTKVKVSNQ